MVDNIQKNILEEIRALYQEDEVAQRFFDWVAERKNDSAETSLDRIASRLNLHRSEAVVLAKQLDNAKCARFILGRKGAKSRMQWAYSLRSLGMAAKGRIDQLDDVDPDIAAESAEQISESFSEMAALPIGDGIEHKFKLRLDTTVTIALPGDLTTKEAERLAAFIQSLPFES
jgi:hypothetical protein